jgi:hypothetical protein
MKKQLSLWLVSFDAEFIALLLNSFLGLLFWPSFKRRGRSVTFSCDPHSCFLVFCVFGGGEGASRMWVLAPANFSGKLLVACLLGLFRGLRAFFCGLGYPEGDFQRTFLTEHEEKGFELPTTSFTVELSTTGYLAQWSPLTILFGHF